MSGSTADAQNTSSSAATSSGSGGSQKFWEFADLGFDTGKKLWFVQFYNAINENVGTYYARTVEITGGWAAQYQWKDAKGAPFWHVRERIYASEVERLSMDPGGGTLTVVFKEGEEQPAATEIPSDYAYILYAYHLSSKNDGRAPMGFVEFYRSDDSRIAKVQNRWIIAEGLRRRTVGEYPGVRIRVERGDVDGITLTGTAIVIRGKAKFAL